MEKLEDTYGILKCLLKQVHKTEYFKTLQIITNINNSTAMCFICIMYICMFIYIYIHVLKLCLIFQLFI